MYTNYCKQIALYFIDISKLIFGGSFLAGVVNVEYFGKEIIGLKSISSTTVFALIGFIILRKSN